MNEPLSFGELKIGQNFSFKHRVLQEDVEAFATLSGDFNPLHVNKEFAANTQFRRPVVHGIFTASLVSRLVGMHLPGPGALWISQSFEFKGPAFVGDELTISAKLMKISQSVKIATISVSVVNQKNEIILDGTGRVTLLEKKADSKEEVSLNNKTLVIGGSKGIGAGIIEKLLHRGDEVIFTYNKSKEASEDLINTMTSETNRIRAFKCDLSLSTDIETLVKNLSDLDFIPNVLIFCASRPPIPRQFKEVSSEEFVDFFEIQIVSTFKILQFFLDKLCPNKNNSIVFISSLYAEGTPPAQQIPYITSKAALNGFMRALAVEIGPKGVNINCVAPGMTDTDMISDLPQKVKLTAKMQTPLRRLAQVEDIAGTVSFLTTSDARHITGQVIIVSGGAR